MHPLQGSRDLQNFFDHIKIASIPDREGQILRNRLLMLLASKGECHAPSYQLSIEYHFVSRGVSLQKDATTGQELIDLAISLTLSDFKSGAIAYAATEIVSGDRSISGSNPYSSLVAERGTKIKLLESAAQSIRLHLIAFFDGAHTQKYERINLS